MWKYNGKVVRVVDGDTYDIMLDLGFYIYHKIRVRLRGVDTPETYGNKATPEGKIASDFVNNLIFGKDVVITTYKNNTSTFDRWEADVQFTNGIKLDQLSEHLVKLGYANKV